MRVAAIYDIHGNLPALEAVLHDIRLARVDQVVIGGDVIPGPMQNETLETLLNLKIPVQFIQGNCEVAVLAEKSGKNIRTLPEQARQAVRWSAQQLDADSERLLAGWPKTVRLQIPELGQAIFCHGTPRDEDEYFTRLTPADQLLPIFEGLGASLVVCGHTHMQFDRMIGKTRVVNAGSAGMPFGRPGAYWLLLGPDVELRRTAYDLKEAADRVRATSYPQAQEFAAKHILEPPSEEQMLGLLTAAKSK
jgi:putative phosphoesterase